MGGAGNDTVGLSASVLVNARVDLGAGADLVSASANVTGATLLGGASNDTISFGGSGVTSARILAGAGDDVIKFNENVTATSIIGGAGNDSVHFHLGGETEAGNNNRRRWVQQHLLLRIWCWFRYPQLR